MKLGCNIPIGNLHDVHHMYAQSWCDTSGTPHYQWLNLVTNLWQTLPYILGLSDSSPRPFIGPRANFVILIPLPNSTHIHLHWPAWLSTTLSTGVPLPHPHLPALQSPTFKIFVLYDSNNFKGWSRNIWSRESAKIAPYRSPTKQFCAMNDNNW